MANRFQVWERDGLIRGFVRGPEQNGSEPAPEGFHPRNAREWLKVDGEWVRDKEAAEARRDEVQSGENTKVEE